MDMRLHHAHGQHCRPFFPRDPSEESDQIPGQRSINQPLAIQGRPDQVEVQSIAHDE
jgi:hypothetical protein